MQIYIDFLVDGVALDWKMYINPNISLDSRGIGLNDVFYKYVQIARISIDGKTKSFVEPFIYAKRDDVVTDGAKELLNAKNLSIPVMTFLVENLAPKCIAPLSNDLKPISDVDLKKYARTMAVRLARQRREVIF